MDVLISRQALLDKFEPWLKVKDYNDSELNVLKAILYEIRFMRSAQPAFDARDTQYNLPIGTDCISRQAAIDAFNTNLNELIVGGEENAKTVENYLNRVLDKIKCLPSALGTNLAEVGTDTISRQAAINKILGQPPEPHYPSWYAEQIKELPSAQPEILACGEGELIVQPEIVRCKDCTHYDGEWCFENRHYLKDYDFCSRAERRTE